MAKKSGKSDEAYVEALRRIEACRESGETDLNLSRLGLSKLPPQVFQLAALTRLGVLENELTTLPPEISQLKELTTLDLRSNRLSTLPAEIGQLNALRGLYVGNNQLSTLPSEIGQLTSLTGLDLSRNQLNTLPKEVFELRALTGLNLSGNQLATLPPEVGGLSKLVFLDLGSNKLNELPVNIRHLAELHALYLQNNEALQIPGEVLGSSWSSLAWSDPPEANPKPNPPSEILDYYFRLQGGTRPLNEFKLILVGHGAVGKTALVNRLVRDEFTPTDMTRGIHIEPWQVKAGSDLVAAHVWDFGGQDIMHGTHQFFLTQRSLYILALAARENKQNDDAEYWLKTIAAFGGDSPVIVVLNKSDERPFEVNENALRKKYPTIQQFIKTDCKSGIGIEELNAAISQCADHLEGLRDAFPASWFTIKERLSGMKENYLTFEDFRRECADLGEPDGSEQEALAGVLHILGIALNFRDDNRLRETSVLNPLWVTGGLYAVLNDNELSRRHGLLAIDDFVRVLPEGDYPEHTHEFLRELMGKFELCFPLESKGGRLLIPELLSQQEPDAAGPLDRNESLAFTYHYSRLVPHGLVPRLIVRLYQIIKDNLRWRTGAVFEWFDAEALVKADEDDRCIRIRAHGSPTRRRELLGIIRQEFDELHRQFQGLLPREVIQLPDYPDVAVDYSHVEAAARAGMKEMPIFADEHMIKADPDALLREFEVKGEERDAGNRGAIEVEPTPPPRKSRRRKGPKKELS